MRLAGHTKMAFMRVAEGLAFAMMLGLGLA